MCASRAAAAVSTAAAAAAAAAAPRTPALLDIYTRGPSTPHVGNPANEEETSISGSRAVCNDEQLQQRQRQQQQQQQQQQQRKIKHLNEVKQTKIK